MNVVSRREGEITLNIEYQAILAKGEIGNIWFAAPPPDNQYFFVVPDYELKDRIKTRVYNDEQHLLSNEIKCGVVLKHYFTEPINRVTQLQITYDEYKQINAFLKSEENFVPIKTRPMYNAIFELNTKE